MDSTKRFQLTAKSNKIDNRFSGAFPLFNFLRDSASVALQTCKHCDTIGFKTPIRLLKRSWPFSHILIMPVIIIKPLLTKLTTAMTETGKFDTLQIMNDYLQTLLEL